MIPHMIFLLSTCRYRILLNYTAVSTDSQEIFPRLVLVLLLPASLPQSSQDQTQLTKDAKVGAGMVQVQCLGPGWLWTPQDL